MSRLIIANAETVENIIKNLNGTAAALYVVIIGHRNGKTGEYYITQEKLAEKTGLSERSIIRTLNSLKEAGYLKWEKGCNFSSKANSYAFPRENTSEEVSIIEKKKVAKIAKVEKIKENIKNKAKEENNKEDEEQEIKEENNCIKANLIKASKDLDKKIKKMPKSFKKQRCEGIKDGFDNMVKNEAAEKLLIEQMANLIDEIGEIGEIETYRINGIGTLKDYVFEIGIDGAVKKYA